MRKVQKQLITARKVSMMNTASSGKSQQTKRKKIKAQSQSTTVAKELKQKEKKLGLHYNQRTDQVLPDVNRNHSTPNDVDDRPGADVEIVKMDVETKKVISAFLGKVATMDDTQLKVIGGTLVRRYPDKAEVLTATMAGAGEDLAVAAVKSAVLVYPEAVEKELGLGRRN